MAPEQIDKKADWATDKFVDRMDADPDNDKRYTRWQASGHYIGYKQGYTDALSDAKEDAIEFLLWCQDKGYQRVYARDYWIDPKGDNVANTVYQLYDLYQASKTK